MVQIQVAIVGNFPIWTDDLSAIEIVPALKFKQAQQGIVTGQERIDIEAGFWIGNHPDKACLLEAGQFNQAVTAFIDIAEFLVGQDAEQLAVLVEAPGKG